MAAKLTFQGIEYFVEMLEDGRTRLYGESFDITLDDIQILDGEVSVDYSVKFSVIDDSVLKELINALIMEALQNLVEEHA